MTLRDPLPLDAAPISATSARVGRGAVRMIFADGLHPATRLPLLTEEQPGAERTCGACIHLYEHRVSEGVRLKCDRKAARNRRGPDLRPEFPACTAFTPVTAQRAGNED